MARSPSKHGKCRGFVTNFCRYLDGEALLLSLVRCAARRIGLSGIRHGRNRGP